VRRDLSVDPAIGQPVRVRSVVVVRKTTAVESIAARGDRKMQHAIALGDPLADRVRLSHSEHARSAEIVEDVLKSSGVAYQVVSNLGRRVAAHVDLVVTVGGDGTFLRASHSLGAQSTTPLLGVNSAASTSVGYFCAATADEFAALFHDVCTGKVTTRGLWRMQVLLNEKPVPDLALNDVLLAHRSPAETSRYSVAWDGLMQEQKSSGIWISTAAGSTAAIRSAGGELLQLDARVMQFRVRELMPWSVQGPPLVGGRVAQRLVVTSRMSRGMVYIDGGHHRFGFGFGDRLEFRLSARPMPWIARANLDDRRILGQ